MTKPQDIQTNQQPRTLVIGVQTPNNPSRNIQSYYDEFINLVRSNGMTYEHAMFMRLRQIDPGYFFTQGKLEEIVDFCNKNAIETVVISETLSLQQERNLTKLFDLTVIDRTALILQIFETGATSAEGKIQVAIAVLQFIKSRVSGKGVSMSQQAGGIGGKGPGETSKERELQHLETLILRHRRDLKQLEKTRDVQRKRRLNRQIPLICLVGYTNAGKSTILNALTNSNVLAQDKLFATLDTTTRELYIDGEKKGLISDTVGFIQQLPHNLIEAFKSTLSELQYADLLLHVIDISDSDWQTHIRVAHSILKDLEVNKPMLYVFNKADKRTTPLPEEIERFQPHVITNAQTVEGLAPLVQFLASWKQGQEI